VELRTHTQTVLSDAPLYNLQGQRVTRQHKGLLIQDGKKVLNKYPPPVGALTKCNFFLDKSTQNATKGIDFY
jgi:hypothetical protein